MTATAATAGSDPALVRCADLARTFGTGAAAVVAVHGASAAVLPGMRVALTGPSGSGKSTLLHLMAGLDTPTAGELSWPALGGPPALRPGTVGIVFQGPSLVPALDVSENVTLPLLLAGRSQDDAAETAALALERMGIGGLAGKLPEELSGGQAQRVAVARVLACRPRLILADEPTGQLDAAAASRVVSALLAAVEDVESADGTAAALVVATHDPAVAARLEQRWQLRDGRLVTDGSGQ